LIIDFNMKSNAELRYERLHEELKELNKKVARKLRQIDEVRKKLGMK